MFIEKSFDWGKTWTIMRYFSADCELDFPEAHIGELIYCEFCFHNLSSLHILCIVRPSTRVTSYLFSTL